MEQGPPVLPLAKDDILSQLEHMLASPHFHASPQQIALLKYVVYQTLDENAREIREDILATEAFGREADFDSTIDPIVSIQADLLRRALMRYFESAGQNDPVRIDIPPGTYIPGFKKQKMNGP